MELTKGYCDFLILCYNIIIDYSPEIDKYLKIICSPTFKGHCGSILFDIAQIEFVRNSNDAEKALLLYFGIIPQINSESLE